MTGGIFDITAPQQAALRTAATSNIPAGLPDYVKRRLIAAGLMDEATGATRRARARTCEVCRRPVMRGITADWGGSTADCDPTPLTAIGEATALINGHRTYELRYLGDRYEIDRRTPERIHGNPIGTQGLDVLVEHTHDGGHNYPRGQTMIKDRHQTTPDAQLPDKPPF